MRESEVKLSNNDEKKAKIRERYKGVSEDQLSVIPALPKLDIFDKDRSMRVAVYARVSTDDPNQTSSYELQKNHYTDLVSRNPNWKLVDIYADEGISGTSLQHRDSFIRMIDDCKTGKIDLIVTKSVSRFARNILDGIGYARKLAAMNPPVGIYFETENINSLNKDSEMALAFLATMAQEESHNKSEIMNASIEMRFRRGIFLTPPLLGYDQDADGNLIINDEEATTVRLIFFMYLYGYSCSQIADSLTKLGRKTKKGNTVWSAGSIMQQLQNERHCGSVLARKTWTPNYLDHKSKKNRQDRNQYLQENHHEPIIDREDFMCVQHMIGNAKYGNKGILPELHIITKGALRGYVIVNPRWAGFKPQDYYVASASVYDKLSQNKSDGFSVNAGDFDLRGYEIARAQFFDIGNKLTVSFLPKQIKFSASCLKKLDSDNIEILVHPTEKLLAVRPAPPDSRNVFLWRRRKNGQIVSRELGTSAISPCLYGLFEWNQHYRYRITGIYLEKNGDKLLLFNLHDAETFIPNEAESDTDTEENAPKLNIQQENVRHFGTKTSTLAFPVEWAETFGSDYYTYRKSQEITIRQTTEPLIVRGSDSVFNPTPEITVPDPTILAGKIQSIVNMINSGDNANE